MGKIFSLLSVIFLGFLSLAPLQAQASSIACDAYTYSDWTACSSSGLQSRTPTTHGVLGCINGEIPIMVQLCTPSNPPSTICAGFTYLSWGACDSTGLQIRTANWTVPSGGCIHNNIPIIVQKCTPLITICTSFTYSAWSTCASNGTQTHYITASSPAGCTGGTPVLTQACTYVPPTCTTVGTSCCLGDSCRQTSPTCVTGATPVFQGCSSSCEPQWNCVPSVTACTYFTYSDWGTCSSSSTQARTVLDSYPSGCTGGTPILSQTCTPTCTDFTYSDWGTCSSTGTRTRIVLNSSPSGCTGGTKILSQSCTPTSNCSYVFSDWSTCLSSGTQTRTIISHPTDCEVMGSPTLTQSCTYNAPTCTSFNYSAWSTCSTSGTQTRTTTYSYPSGCTGGTPILSQSCTPVTSSTCSSFTYSSWSTCSTSGTQTRTTTYSYPSGCTGGTPILSQPCTPVTISTCSSFTYSAWSTCSTSGTQTRATTYSYPPGCTGGSPILTQSCTPATNPVTPIDNSALIAQLQAQIALLLAQVREMQAQQGIIPTTPTGTTWCHTFYNNVGFVNSGTDEVVQLHTALQNEGISYTPDAVNIYGQGTVDAVTQFQQKYGITPTSGWVGPKTRVKLNTVYGCKF